MRVFGIIAICTGVIWSLFAFMMTTTVHSGYGEVNNIGLMDERRNHLTGGLVTVVVGVLLFGFGSRSRESEASETDTAALRPCPLCAELIKKEAIKCKHCGSEIAPVVSKSVPPALVPAGGFFQRPDDMPRGEYQDQILKRFGAKPHGDGYVLGDKKFSSFDELVNTLRA